MSYLWLCLNILSNYDVVVLQILDLVGSSLVILCGMDLFYSELCGCIWLLRYWPSSLVWRFSYIWCSDLLLRALLFRCVLRSSLDLSDECLF